MSRRGDNGGWNKSHGTVEKVHQIDSYDMAEVRGWGEVWCGPVLLEAYHDQDYGEGCLFLPGQSNPLEIVMNYKANGYGGRQTFFLCPACGKRVRYLYQTGGAFLCRCCAHLNYRSQQETRSDSMYYYEKGMALAEKRLDTWPGFRPDGFSFCEWIPERPRYMHQTTYRRYLARFLRHRRQHEIRELEDMERVLRICRKGLKL